MKINKIKLAKEWLFISILSCISYFISSSEINFLLHTASVFVLYYALKVLHSECNQCKYKSKYHYYNIFLNIMLCITTPIILHGAIYNYKGWHSLAMIFAQGVCIAMQIIVHIRNGKK